MIGIRFRLPFLVLGIMHLVAAGLLAQDATQFNGIDVDDLLKDAFLVNVDVTVISPDDLEELWATQINKITILGRAVNISLQGSDSRLKVTLTLYPAERGRMLLVAQNENWIGEEYSSTLSSFPVAFGEMLYYYPLGRAADSEQDDYVEVRMAIHLLPFLETLDEETRSSLLSSLDESTHFNFTTKDP